MERCIDVCVSLCVYIYIYIYIYIYMRMLKVGRKLDTNIAGLGYRNIRIPMRHGGKCNASTGDDKTCYQFDVSPAFLETWRSVAGY